MDRQEAGLALAHLEQVQFEVSPADIGQQQVLDRLGLVGSMKEPRRLQCGLEQHQQGELTDAVWPLDTA